MPAFYDMFCESEGRPIVYNGMELVPYDTWNVEDKDEFRLTFESVGSEWRQGVSIGLLKPQSRRKRGEILIEGKTFIKPFFIWQDLTPNSLNFIIIKPLTALEVYNAWDTANGSINYLYNGSAMRIEQIENGRRYFCNDGHPDDNLDDLIFRIERIK